MAFAVSVQKGNLHHRNFKNQTTLPAKMLAIWSEVKALPHRSTSSKPHQS